MIRQLALTVITLFAITVSNAQSVGINTDNSQPNSSAMLDVKSTNKGFLPPRVSLTSTADVTTVASPANGLLVYNTNTSITNGTGIGLYYYNGTRWVPCGQDNFQLILGTWKIKSHEIENFSGNINNTKQIEVFVNSTLTFNTDQTYASVYEGNPPTTGTWEMVNSNYYVFDKNTSAERFYYILVLDSKNLVIRGPFRSNGSLVNTLNYLFTSYSTRL